MGKLRVGLVGAGGIVEAHLPRLSERGDAVELVGVADINREAAQKLADKYGMAHVAGDFHELLPHIDALLICVPTHLHAPIAVTALEAAKAVFCEKPLARTIEQAHTIAAALQKTGGVLQVGFVRRFDDEWLAWRSALRDNRIGQPIVWRDVAASAGPPSQWFFRDEQGGGPFLDGCIHNFDFALHTFGPAQWAFCHGRTFSETQDSHTAIDTGTATVRFVSGDEMLLAWSWGLPAGCQGARVFEMLGPQGTLTWPQGDPYHDYGAAQRHFIIHNGSTREEVNFPGNSLTTAFAQQMDEFIEVAQRRQTPRAGITEGQAALQLALAVLQSARSGEVVHL
jgi:myo-inositol 2-dehydrogenase/D-chiro-inositol 1-dehydrogenase